MGIDKDKRLSAVDRELRRHAEDRLRSEQGSAVFFPPSGESQRLIHELQVHQIELEMQNEELRRAWDERDQMEAMLGKYSDLYDFAPVGYFNLGHNGIIHAVNLTGAKYLGVERSSLVNRHLDEYISDETLPVFHDFLDTVFASETKVSCEVVFLKERHSPLNVQIEAVVSESRDECRSAVIDITAQKQAEVQSRESERLLRKAQQIAQNSEEHYRAIVEAYDGQMYICSQDNRISFMNQKLIERTGRNAVGESCFKALNDFEQVCPWCANDRVFRGETIRWETKSPKDGNWYAVVNTPIHYADGTVAKLGMIQDITERKRTEDALRKSEALYHSLVETSQDLIWQCDSEGRFSFLNLAVEQVFGYELEEMLGKKFSDFQTAETAERDLMVFAQVMHGNPVYGYETTFIGKNGNDINLMINATFISDENDEIVGVSGTSYDITQRKQMEKELRDSKAAAEAANTTKSQFLATMSHEIRTPMNGVIGMLELLKHTELTPEQKEYIESAKLSGDELVHLLNDILDISKIEADKIELEQSNFDLRTVISHTINLLSLQAHEKGITLVQSIDTGVPTALKGDASRLRQIIINLIGNAIKFTTKGSISLQIRKDAEDERSVILRFLFCDTGIGIAAEKLTTIFEPFTQADSSTTRAFGGTGLGLAICKRLVELMGGGIGVESMEGQGSTFWFTVVMEKQAQPVLSPSSIKEDGFETNSHRGKGLERGILSDAKIRILLTEDDPKAQKIVPRLLEHYGYQVDVACDGKEALQALENNDYRLVLMDCMMPVMNGYEVTAIIRDPASAVRRHDIPIVALTGNAMKHEREYCIAAGMDDHLPKPLILDDLLAKLDMWVEK